jgi:hypothetical protein
MRVGLHARSVHLVPPPQTKHSNFKAYFEGAEAPLVPPAAPAATGPLGAATAAAPPGAAARKSLTRMLDDEHRVDLGLRRAMSGQRLDAQNLLVLQCDVMRYAQEVELASRLIDRVAGDLKQVLQTQV